MILRRALAALGVVILVLLPARPAAAHTTAGSTDFRVELTDVQGDATGATLRVLDEGGSLEVRRTTAAQVMVLGYEGEPYLRLDATGTWRNTSSPATYLDQSRYAQVTLPPQAVASNPPTWERIGAGLVVRWHDHRSHWMSPALPAVAQADPDHDHVVYEDRIQFQVDGRDVSIGTRITYVPPPSRIAWFGILGTAAALAMIATAIRPRLGFVFAPIAGVAALVTRATGPVWLIVPAVGVALVVVGLLRRDLRWTGAGAVIALVAASRRLDVVQHPLLLGAVPPLAQRLAFVTAVAAGAGAVIALTARPTRRDAVSSPGASPPSSA